MYETPKRTWNARVCSLRLEMCVYLITTRFTSDTREKKQLSLLQFSSQMVANFLVASVSELACYTVIILAKFVWGTRCQFKNGAAFGVQPRS